MYVCSYVLFVVAVCFGLCFFFFFFFLLFLLMLLLLLFFFFFFASSFFFLLTFKKFALFKKCLCPIAFSVNSNRFFVMILPVVIIRILFNDNRRLTMSTEKEKPYRQTYLTFTNSTH